MYMYVCIFAYTYRHVCVYVHLSIHIFHTHTHTHTHNIFVHTFTHMYRRQPFSYASSPRRRWGAQRRRAALAKEPWLAWAEKSKPWPQLLWPCVQEGRGPPALPRTGRRAGAATSPPRRPGVWRRNHKTRLRGSPLLPRVHRLHPRAGPLRPAKRGLPRKRPGRSRVCRVSGLRG